MLKKLWQRFVKKAESKDDKQKEDNRTGTLNHRADQIIREGDVWAYLISLTVQFALMVGRAAVDKVQEGLDKGNHLLAVWDALRDVWSVSGQSMATVVTGSVIVAEIWRLAMVLAGFVRKRLERKLGKQDEAIADEWAKVKAERAKMDDTIAAVGARVEAERAKIKAERAKMDDTIAAVGARVEAERARADAERARADEQQAAIAGWYARMQAAQEKGDPFDEPPPPPRRDNGASES